MAQPDEDFEQPGGQSQPGGRSSRGPDINPGGHAEPQRPVPPYERSDSPDAQAAAAQGVAKAFHADEHGGEPGPPPPVSEQERHGVPSTDTTAATPLGVGQSTTTGGEELAAGSKEAGRHDTGTQGPAQRPTGTSTGADSTGVDPQDAGDDSPNLTAGDQGG